MILYNSMPNMDRSQPDKLNRVVSDHMIEVEVEVGEVVAVAI